MHYTFDDCTLDTQRYELRQGGLRLPLRRKVFQVLVYLIEQRDRVVPRDELLAQVWPDQYVGEETLTSCVKAVRRAVGDSGRAQRVILTVHGQGLRFVAEVMETDAPGAACQAMMSTAAPAPACPPPALLVGREAELAALQRWYTAAQQGTRQVGFITGEAGVGKTALVEAFVTQVAAAATVWIGHGQCIEQYGLGEAYLPVLEALGRLCRGPHGAQVLTWLRQQAPSWLAQMPAILPVAERDTVLQLASGATQARMLRELAEALEVLTAERPLLLVLEDLHWSDMATLEWLACVARRRDPARLLVLATYRPSEARGAAHSVDALAQDLLVRHQGAALPVGPLSAPEVAQYIARRFGEGDLTAQLAPVLHQRTQGHALFLVTTVADWQQRGVVRQGPDGWALAGPLDTATVSVPATLRHLIEQQFERLAPAAQAVIEVASMAGVEFTAAAVAAGVGVPAEEVDAQCATLVRQGQFVRAHGTATWPDGTVTGRYSFAHALYQEVVYDRVPVGMRSRVHQHIGARLEQGYGAQSRAIAAELAEHFMRGQDVPRAIQYLQQAGENALRRSAHQAAITHVTTALPLLEKMPDTPERSQRELALHLTLGTSLMATRGFAAPETGAAFRRAHALRTQVDNPEQAFAAVRGLALFYTLRGELTPALAMGEQLLQQAHHSRQPALRLEAHRLLGSTLLWQGKVIEAREHFAQGLALYKPQQHVSTFLYGVDSGVASVIFLAMTLWVLGYPDQARQRSREAITLAQELEHPMSLACARTFTAMLYQWSRDSALTQQWTEATFALATEHGFSQWRETNAFLLGWALAQQGHVAEGLTRMLQSLDAWQAMGADIYRPYCLALLAEAHTMAGDLDAAWPLFNEAFAVVRRNGEGLHEAEMHRLYGVLLQAHASTPYTLEHAEVSLQHALARARQRQAKSLELRAAMSLARLWQQQGKPVEARDLLAPIYDWFTEGFDTADLREAQALLEALA